MFGSQTLLYQFEINVKPRWLLVIIANVYRGFIMCQVIYVILYLD